MSIAVVVPVYKVPFNYLDQCINSIVRQTYKNLEIIIVDDGSPKEWAEKCDGYARTDSRIRVIHKPNGGLSDARNRGISEAKSEWITFVDGDDWIEEKFIEWAVERIESQAEKSDIYYFSGFRNYPKKQVEGVPHFSDGTRFVTYQEREDLQLKCFTNIVAIGGNFKGITISSACMKMYKTEFLKTKGLLFPIVPYAEDSLFYLDAIEKASSIEYVAKSVYHYRFAEESMVNKYRPNAVKEQEIYFNYIFNFAKRSHKSEEFVNKVYMRVITSMQLLIKQKFFHPENTDTFFKRQRECATLFRKEPYRSALKKVDAAKLRKIVKVKLYLLRFHLYWILEQGRRICQKKLINNN